MVLAAGGQDPLRLAETGVVDDRGVAAGGSDSAEGQLAQVDAVVPRRAVRRKYSAMIPADNAGV